MPLQLQHHDISPTTTNLNHLIRNINDYQDVLSSSLFALHSDGGRHASVIMSRVDNLGGSGRTNSTRIKPIKSSPTQYPTYLGTTYFPTYFWSSNAPIVSGTREKIDNKNHSQHEQKHTNHKKELKNAPTSRPSTSPTATIVPTIRTAIENKHLPSNLSETPTIRERNIKDSPPSPSTSRPSLEKPVDIKVTHTTPPTRKVRPQETNSPTRPPTIMPTRSNTVVPTPAPLSLVPPSKRWSGPSRGRPFSQVRTPNPTVTEVQISSQEPTGTPTSAPLATREPSNLSTRAADDNISAKSDVTRNVEPDKTIMVNLTFRVKENPNYLSTGGQRYYIIDGPDQDDEEFASAPTKFPVGSTHEPTVVPTTYSPTKKKARDALIPTFLPSYLPTLGNNENIMVRSDDLSESIFQKRSCPGYPYGLDSTSETKEQEVIFAYAIQTTDGLSGQSIETSVKMLQLWILDDVANNLLHCPDDGSSSGRFTLDRQYDGFQNAVSSVYYMENDSVTSLSECTPTFGDATDCAIIQSAIYVTAELDETDAARKNTISFIKDQFESGLYRQGTIIHTTYLGPDADELTMIGDSSKEKAGGVVTKNPTIFYIAIGVVFLACCALAACMAMLRRVRKERKNAAASTFVPSHRHSKVPTEDFCDDSYPPSFRNSYAFQ